MAVVNMWSQHNRILPIPGSCSPRLGCHTGEVVWATWCFQRCTTGVRPSRSNTCCVSMGTIPLECVDLHRCVSGCDFQGILPWDKLGYPRAWEDPREAAEPFWATLGRIVQHPIIVRQMSVRWGGRGFWGSLSGSHVLPKTLVFFPPDQF